MRLYVENIAWYVALSGLCHERLTPETQQSLLCRFRLSVRKDEGNILAESAPMRFLHLAMAVTSGNFRQNFGLPQALLAFIENELDGGYLRVLNCRAQECVE